MTTATLGFAIDSSTASSAAADLDKLTAAANRTQQAADKLEAEASSLGRAMGQAATAAGRARPDVDGLARSFGNQDEHVRAFRMEVERLTMKYQPLARATQSYEASISEINRAHQLGVINAQQMQKALDAERMSFERLKTSATAAGSAVKAANSNSGAQRAGAVNAGFQIQDTVTSALGGSSIGMITGQQGFQLAGALSSMEKPVAGLAAAFASLLNPVSLVSLGLVAGTAALVQYFSTGSEGADGMSDDLREQAELIQHVAERWGDATPRLKQYADEVKRIQEMRERKESADFLATEETQKALDIVTKLRPQFSALAADLGGGNDIFKDIQQGISELNVGLQDGSATLGDLQKANMAVANALDQFGTPSIKTFAEEWKQLIPIVERYLETAEKARQEGIYHPGMSRSYRSYADTVFNPDGPIQGERLPLPEQGPNLLRRPLRELEGDGSPDGPAMITNSDGLLVNVPIPDRKPNFFELEEQREKLTDLEKAYRRAQEAKADFWLDVGFTERQSERSALDQRIATTLNRYGFDENMNSPEANILRQQYQREEAKQVISSFMSDFQRGVLENGGDIGKALANAALRPICGPEIHFEIDILGEAA